jgi:class 3 adenylate cyclase/tetratricopeptide (TPR) repeat protein
MESSTADAQIDEQLRPYVPELLLRWEHGVSFQTLTGTLVSADIAGFTALSERLAAKGREGAEELSVLINGCFEGMTADCLVEGGDILKFGGDSMLVFFDGDHHVRRACRAAMAMRRTIKHPRSTQDGRRLRLALSTGIHTGLHSFYVIHNGHQELVVSGPGTTATVAAETAATAGQILLSSDTAALLPDSWLGETTVDGVLLRRTFGGAPPASRSAETRRAADFVPPDQQAQILAGAINEHRQVSISFVEFAGTDRLRPDELAARLQHLGSNVASVCQRYGVFWLTTDTSGDGGRFVLTAGAPISRGGDEDRLLRAVRDVIDAGVDIGLDLRAGVNRGYVFAGDLGSHHRRTYTTLGDAMNLAARLMTTAGGGEIIASRPIIDWASSEIEYEPLEPFMVKGKAAPIHAGKMGRVIGRRSDLDRADTELCGRNDELATLLDRATAAIAGHGSVSVITGEPGIGKSRLALEVLRQRPELSIAFARCQPYDRLAAFSVAEPLILSLIGIDAAAPPPDAGSALLEALNRAAPELAPFAPLLAVVIGAEVEATPESDAVDSKFRRTRTLQLLVQLLQTIVVTPTALFVDDINLADDATRELVQGLIEAASDTPLMVLATSIPEETLQLDPIRLGPLTEADITRLLDALLGEQVVSNEVVRAISARSAGNPLFVGELVRSLAEDPNAPMPPSLEALVASRIDALEPTDRQLLRQAAVLGTEVDIMLLGRATDDRLIRRQDRWERLSRFLEWAAPGVVRFRYDTYWRVVYDGLSFAARRAAHRRVIDVLEVDLVADDISMVTLLAAHSDKAGDAERTWRYGLIAAESSASQSMYREAAQLFEMCLASPPSDLGTEQLAPVLEHAADTFVMAGRFEAVLRSLARLSRVLHEPIDQARLWRKRGDALEQSGHAARAVSAFGRARRAWTTIEWSLGIPERARLDVSEAALAYRQGHYETAWRRATAAFSQAQLSNDWAVAAHAAHIIDNLVIHIRWGGSEITRPDVRRLYKLAGDRVGEARHVNNLAVDLYFDGKWVEAAQLYRECAQQCAIAGDVVYEATALNNIAEILSDQGRFDDAEPLFRSANRTWQSVGFATGVALAEANLGRLATRTGDLERADRLLASAMDRFQTLGAESFVHDVAFRVFENHLRAGTVTDAGVAQCAELTAMPDLDANLAAYAHRLIAEANGNDGRSQLASTEVTRSIEIARAADIPFELAQSLAVRAQMTGSDESLAENDLHEAAAIFDRLGCNGWWRFGGSAKGGSVMVEQAVRRDR